jgi:hypothetical protein
MSLRLELTQLEYDMGLGEIWWQGYTILKT